MVDLIAIDLDGTLLNSNSELSPESLDALHLCKQRSVLRVIATGRSVETALRVLDPDAPIDYLIFSSGAGTYLWDEQRLIRETHLDTYSCQRIAAILLRRNLSFMAHDPIPNNHHFLYREGQEAHLTDFALRLEAYRAEATPLQEGDLRFGEGLSQFIVTLPPDLELFESIRREVEQYGQIIRATSPFDNCSIWMEIFPQGVSKGNALRLLCEQLSIPSDRVAAVGNDYNDLSMLELFPHAYVVENAPSDLRERFQIIPSNDDDGVATLINRLLSV